jgi:hypothetical protein
MLDLSSENGWYAPVQEAWKVPLAEKQPLTFSRTFAKLSLAVLPYSRYLLTPLINA